MRREECEERGERECEKGRGSVRRGEGEREGVRVWVCSLCDTCLHCRTSLTLIWSG